MADFAERLKSLRLQAGLTQRELAEKLGIAHSTLGMYELGKRVPDIDTMDSIADYFNVTIDYISGKDSRSLYYLTPEQAQFAQEMFEKPGQRTLFDMTKNATPEQMDAIRDIVKSIMKLGDKK